jgi:hypothetical protein
MALITSADTGNFSAGATWTGGVVPGVGDEARASNGHTITIDVDTTCDEVSNAGTGIFTLASGVTLTANVTSKSTTTSRNCLQFTAANPAQGFIVGNCTGGTVLSSHAVNITASGIINITGNVNGGGAGGTASNGVFVSAGTLNVTGNVTGGSALNASGVSATSGSVNIVGIVTGGNGTTTEGLRITAAGAGTVTGTIVGGVASVGAINSSTGAIFATRAKGNAYGPGNTSGLAAAVGANNSGLGVIEIEELEYGDFGMSPTSGAGIRLKKLGSNVAVFNYVDSGSAKTLVDATQGQMPAATDVRDGVSYASGALTGSCAVPAAASVAFGVPVDNTTGTAALTPASVWEYATREITGGVVDTLTNAPASVTPSDIWSHSSRTLTSASGPSAADIRTELDTNSTKLANLDATVSSRLASASYTAPANSDISAIKSKTDAINVERINNTATLSHVGNLLAQANS